MNKRIENFLNAWKAKGTSLLAGFRKIYDAVSKKADGCCQIYDILTDEENAAEIDKLKMRVINTAKKVIPKRAEGSIVIGTDDPYNTGRIMEAAAMLYPLYGEGISVSPDFENTKLDFDLDIKGSFRLYVILWNGARIYFNKKLRKIYSDIRDILDNL